MNIAPVRHALVAEFLAALAAGDQLRLLYQPRIDLATGLPCSVEALLRWTHPVLGEMNPSEFIPIMENDQIVGQLTDWVLNSAMTFAAQLRQQGRNITVSANVSPTNLDRGYLTGRLVEMLRVHDLPPSMLEIELTERALIADTQHTRQRLRQLRGIGLGVSIDDFGAGFSNLAYLKQIPANAIKIDKSLIETIDFDRASATIVKWIISLGHELGLRVVAEGVERQATLTMLTDWRCDEAQGYLIGRPMAEDGLLRWLDGHTTPQFEEIRRALTA